MVTLSDLDALVQQASKLAERCTQAPPVELSLPPAKELVDAFAENLHHQDWWRDVYGYRRPTIHEDYMLRLAYLAGAKAMSDLLIAAFQAEQP
ncbi:MAG: hypothetical protein JSU95_03860 [Betaproteobacteria bacterium]|nr:MAG: hypothetical protein JSU95_03860 [Betaproteobacteria bacterium]